MMNVLVTYESKTGFTEKYANWIGEALFCEVKPLAKVTRDEVQQYELIIYGGWIMGGHVSGLDKLRKMQPKDLMVYGVGLTPRKDVNPNTAQINNLGDIPFYYLEGGTNPEKMGFMARTIVEKVTKKKIVFEDHSSKEQLNDLLSDVAKRG